MLINLISKQLISLVVTLNLIDIFHFSDSSSIKKTKESMVSLEKETPAKKLEVEVGHAKLHKEREGMEREIDRVLTLLTKFVGKK